MMRESEQEVRGQKSEVRRKPVQRELSTQNSELTSGPSPQPSPLSTGARGERRTSNVEHPTFKDEHILARGVGTIEGVGPGKVKEFEARGVRTLGDLLE